MQTLFHSFVHCLNDRRAVFRQEQRSGAESSAHLLMLMLATVGIPSINTLGLWLKPTPAQAQVIVNPPVIVLPPVPEKRYVLVDFEVLGQDWGSVWVNGVEVYQFRNFNRRQVLRLKPGAYRIVVTGATRFDIWDAGYLDVVDDTNIVRVSLSKTGGAVVPNRPQLWLPDRTLDWTQVWR